MPQKARHETGSTLFAGPRLISMIRAFHAENTLNVRHSYYTVFAGKCKGAVKGHFWDDGRLGNPKRGESAKGVRQWF